MRTPLFAANWKMHKTCAEAQGFLKTFLPLVKNVKGREILLFPPFTAISSIAHMKHETIHLGAQDMCPEDEGAITGEISWNLVKEFCTHLLVGHSERRLRYSESDELINQKLKKAF